MNDKKYQAEVISAEQRLAAAHLTLELDEFNELFHQDYVILQPGGRVETKAEVLASYASGERYWEIAEVDQMEVRLYGDTAVVIGRWRGRGVNGDERFDYSARFSSIWLRNEDGQWQNVVSQSTEIGEPIK